LHAIALILVVENQTYLKLTAAVRGRMARQAAGERERFVN
jgi:hypothetical protein